MQRLLKFCHLSSSPTHHISSTHLSIWDKQEKYEATHGKSSSIHQEKQVILKKPK